MNKRIVVIGAVIVVVAVVAVALWVFLGGLNPPVDVYARPTPPITTDPESLLPLSVAGMTCTSVTTNEYADAVDAMGIYEGDILIEITRFNAAGDAAGYVDNGYESLSGGTTTKVSTWDQHWFTQTVSDQSLFCWRKGVWVFEVYAPTEATRNEVVQELDF